jgi:[calcium/calmodulin-dependent protein kinase] kinase
VAASSRNNSERSNSGDVKPKRLQRILTASSDKSHAHDPSLDEHLYLGIGAGKNDLMEKPDLLEVPDDDAIAESPQAAEFSIYDLAYEKEVERIRLAQGHEAKVYSNRRVETKQELETDAGPSKSQSGWGHLLNRVREKKDEKSNSEATSGT